MKVHKSKIGKQNFDRILITVEMTSWLYNKVDSSCNRKAQYLVLNVNQQQISDAVHLTEVAVYVWKRNRCFRNKLPCIIKLPFSLHPTDQYPQK